LNLLKTGKKFQKNTKINEQLGRLFEYYSMRGKENIKKLMTLKEVSEYYGAKKNLKDE